MAGPWEKYAQPGPAQAPAPPQPGDGPWSKYAAAPAPSVPDDSPEWADVPLQAVQNLPSSAAHFAGNLYEAVRHPINTAGHIADLGAGALREGARRVLPTAAFDAIDNLGGKESAERASGVAKAAGDFLADRYGSEAGFKKTLANDPVGAAADLSMVLTGGGALAARVPFVGRVGEVAQAAGHAVNPMRPMVAGARRVLSPIAEPVSDFITPQIASAKAKANAFINDKLAVRASASPPASGAVGAEAAADQIIANQLARANISVPELRARFAASDEAARLGSNSRAQNVLAPVDIDPSLQRLAGSAARQNPEASNTAQAFQYARQTGQSSGLPLSPTAALPTRAPMQRPQAGDPPAGQYERVSDALQRALQIKTLPSAYRTDADIIAAAKAEARPAYNAVYDAGAGLDLNPVVRPVLDGWKARLIDEPPPVAAQLNKAIGYFERAMSPGGVKTHIERVDKVKQLLDDTIERAFSSPNGKSRYLGGKLTELKNDILAATDNLPQVGDLYRTARGLYSSRMTMREAIETGRQLARENSEAAIEQFRALSPGEQQLARQGYFEVKQQHMARQKRSADVTQAFQNPREQEILSALIPRTETATGRVRANAEFADRPERFGEFIRNEQRMIGTRNETLGNSKTAERLQDDQALNGMQHMISQAKEAASHGVPGLAIRAIEATINKLFGFRADNAAAIARKLYTASPYEREVLLQALEKRLAPSRAAQFRRLTSELLTETQAAPVLNAASSKPND